MGIIKKIQTVVLLLMTAYPAAVSAEDSNSIYVVIKDRKILNSVSRDDLTNRLIVEPALQLASRYRYTFSVRCNAQPCTIPRLVDRYFDYYPQKFSQSTKSLVEWVRQHNRLSDIQVPFGTTLELPAVPVKPNEAFRLDGIRIYEPSSQAYVRSAAIPTEFLGTPDTAPIRADDFRRAADETMLKLTLEEYRAAFPNPPSPKYATVYLGGQDLSEPRRFSISLLGDGNLPLEATFSPYRAAWRQKWQGQDSPQRRQEISASSLERPLVLVDWDFGLGHGRNVLAAAQAALNALELDFLMPQTEELNPNISAARLKGLVGEFCIYYGKQCTLETPVTSVDQIKFRSAIEWLETYAPLGHEGLEIDQLVLEAVLWKHFHQGSWVSLSFQLRPKEANASLDQILRDSAGFGFVAAGNDPGPLAAEFFPQSLARVWPGRFVNITFGQPDGTIAGAHSRTEGADRTDVAVLAQGESLPHREFPVTAKGSSYAAPWVAAATWAKAIIEGIDNNNVLAELIRASRPTPSMQKPILSGGFFDPFLLLARPKCSILTSDQRIVPISSGQIDYTYTDPEDLMPSSRRVMLCGESHGAIRVFREGQLLKLWRRSEPSGAVRVVGLNGIVASLEVADPASSVELQADQLADAYGELLY